MAKRAAPRRAAPRDIAREKYGTRPRLQKERRGEKGPGEGRGEKGEKTGPEGDRQREREREKKVARAIHRLEAGHQELLTSAGPAAGRSSLTCTRACTPGP